MYDFLKTPEQRKQENRRDLIILALIFGVPLLFVLVMVIITSNNNLKNTTNNTSKVRCSTVTEPYSNAEHITECEGDYDWIDEQLQMEADFGREYEENLGLEYENQKLDEELERLDAEYWESYCNENPYECN